MTKISKTVSMELDLYKSAKVFDWIFNRFNRYSDKISWSSYNGCTTFYFELEEDYFMFMMQCYE